MCSWVRKHQHGNVSEISFATWHANCKWNTRNVQSDKQLSHTLAVQMLMEKRVDLSDLKKLCSSHSRKKYYQQIILQQGPIHPQQPLHILFRTFYLAFLLLLWANSYRNPTFKVFHVENTTSWAFANSQKFQIFYNKNFSLLVCSFTWMFIECWERDASQKPVQHWSALSWTSISQYICHVTAEHLSKGFFRRMSGRTCWIHSPAGSSSAARPDLRIGVKQAGSWKLQLWLAFLENMQRIIVQM